MTLILLLLCTSLHAQFAALYKPEGEPKAAVIVCPGGSYFWLDKEGEGSLVGDWLASQGIIAYVLHYRTAGWFVQSVRKEFDGPVGVMGFSAGGHLAMSAGEFFGTDFTGKADGANLRPDFVASIYPVVSMREPCTHKRSRRGLLGEGRTKDQSLRDSLSLELHVRPDTPPVFLLRCDDDPVVDPKNSDLLEAALKEKKVPHRYVKYSVGGHGFGADRKKFTEETAHWQADFLKWLEDINYGRY